MARTLTNGARHLTLHDHQVRAVASEAARSGQQPSPKAQPMPTSSQRIPVETSRAGQEAFETLFLQFERKIFARLLSITGDEQAVRDLSQETFLRAWLHFAKLHTYDSPAAWLLRVATNLAIGHLRHRATLVGSAQLLGDYKSLTSSDSTLVVVDYDLVQRTLLALSSKQRATLVLREVYGFSCNEIAHVYGSSCTSTRMTLWCGREQFRTRYTREHGHR